MYSPRHGYQRSHNAYRQWLAARRAHKVLDAGGEVGQEVVLHVEVSQVLCDRREHTHQVYMHTYVHGKVDDMFTPTHTRTRITQSNRHVSECVRVRVGLSMLLMRILVRMTVRWCDRAIEGTGR